jgi:hypothetical protein
MRTWISILIMVLGRDIVPAGDGTGWRQWKSSRFLVSLLPVMGVFLLLFVISFIGLCIAAADQQLESRLTELRASPYMALFGETFLYSEEWDRENPIDTHNLGKWENITIDNIFPPGEIPLDIKETPLFSGIFPYSWIYLDIKRKDGEHLAFQKGMVLPFVGDNVDEGLIAEIKNKLEKGNLPDGTGEGVILSRKGLVDFGWKKEDEYPPFLWVSISRHSSEKEEEIPLRVLGLAARLPYQVSYVISMKQLKLLNGNYYYDKVPDFHLGFLDGYSHEKLRDIKKKLPRDCKIDEPFRKGAVDAVSIALGETWSRLEIIKKFRVPRYDKIKLWMGSPRSSTTYGENYKGAVFHLNPLLFDHFWGRQDFLSKVQEFMERNNVDVRGELIQALQESLNDQKNLGKLRKLFQWGLLAIGLILLVLFSMVLHTRKHLIGTLRMFGIPEIQFILIYLVEGFCFVIIAFAFAVVTLILFTPFGLQISPWSMTSIGLLAKIFIFAELGFILPAIYFLKALQPAEMVSYRT